MEQVKTQLGCDGIFNYHIISNCLLQNVTIKEFRQEKPVVAREDALQPIQFPLQ